MHFPGSTLSLILAGLMASVPSVRGQPTNEMPFLHVPNTYCGYYKQGGDGACNVGRAFNDVWMECEGDGAACMGVLWNACTGPNSDISVNGAWKLLKAGQEIGSADYPTATCGGKNQARGHWDAYIKSSPYVHVPNTYCGYYKQGGDGDCSAGRDFVDVWQECEKAGSEVCMGVLWNACTGPNNSDISVNGAWKLLKAGQEIGSAINPTATCGGRNQARGHWDAYIRSAPTNVALNKQTYQSSTRIGGGASGRAVDGNNEGLFQYNSVSHTTLARNPYWYVDLGAVFSVRSVKIYNRIDCCQERLDFSTISLHDSAGRHIRSMKGPDNAQGVDSFVVNFDEAEDPTGVHARYVMVSLTSVAPIYLSLAEVEVYGTAV